MVDKSKAQKLVKVSLISLIKGGAQVLTHSNLCEPDYITNENCAPCLNSKFGILKKEHTHTSSCSSTYFPYNALAVPRCKKT